MRAEGCDLEEWQRFLFFLQKLLGVYVTHWLVDGITLVGILY